MVSNLPGGSIKKAFDIFQGITVTLLFVLIVVSLFWGANNRVINQEYREYTRTKLDEINIRLASGSACLTPQEATQSAQIEE